MVSNTKDMKVHMKPLDYSGYGLWVVVGMLVCQYISVLCTYH